MSLFHYNTIEKEGSNESRLYSVSNTWDRRISGKQGGAFSLIFPTSRVLPMLNRYQSHSLLSPMNQLRLARPALPLISLHHTNAPNPEPWSADPSASIYVTPNTYQNGISAFADERGAVKLVGLTTPKHIIQFVVVDRLSSRSQSFAWPLAKIILLEFTG